MIAKGDNTLWNHDGIESGSPEGILADAQNRIGQFDRPQVSTTVESITGNLVEAGKILQFVKIIDKDIIGKHITKCLHSCCLSITELPITVRIPVVDTFLFYLRILKLDLLAFQFFDLLIQRMGITVQSLCIFLRIF